MNTCKNIVRTCYNIPWYILIFIDIYSLPELDQFIYTSMPIIDFEIANIYDTSQNSVNRSTFIVILFCQLEYLHFYCVSFF